MVCDHRTLVWKKNTQQFPPHFIWLAKLYWHAWIVAQVRSGGVNDWLPVQGWGFGLGKQGGHAASKCLRGSSTPRPPFPLSIKSPSPR